MPTSITFMSHCTAHCTVVAYRFGQDFVYVKIYDKTEVVCVAVKHTISSGGFVLS